jgi:hypothetical protein
MRTILSTLYKSVSPRPWLLSLLLVVSWNIYCQAAQTGRHAVEVTLPCLQNPALARMSSHLPRTAFHDDVTAKNYQDGPPSEPVSFHGQANGAHASYLVSQATFADRRGAIHTARSPHTSVVAVASISTPNIRVASARRWHFIRSGDQLWLCSGDVGPPAPSKYPQDI